MPWENKSVIDMKKEIMAALAQGQESVSSIALRYSISRKTLYKWKRRYEQEGDPGLRERSRRPDKTDLLRNEEVASRLIKLRLALTNACTATCFCLRRIVVRPKQSRTRGVRALTANVRMRLWPMPSPPMFTEKANVNIPATFVLSIAGCWSVKSQRWEVFASTKSARSS